MIQGQTHIRTPGPWSTAIEQCLHTPQVKWNMHSTQSFEQKDSRLLIGYYKCPCWGGCHDVDLHYLPSGAYDCGILFFKRVVSDYHLRNESLLSESDQFPFLWLDFSWTMCVMKCVLNAKSCAAQAFIIVLGLNWQYRAVLINLNMH